MAVMGWSLLLRVCEQPHRDLPSNTCLQRLLVSLVDLQAQVEPPKHARLQEHLRATTLPLLQAADTEGPTMVWHRDPTASIGSGCPEQGMH